MKEMYVDYKEREISKFELLRGLTLHLQLFVPCSFLQAVLCCLAQKPPASEPSHYKNKKTRDIQKLNFSWPTMCFIIYGFTFQLQLNSVTSLTFMRVGSTAHMINLATPNY